MQSKDNKQWVWWVALDVHTRQVMAFYVGGRSKEAAKKLWQKIPQSYQQNADFLY